MQAKPAAVYKKGSVQSMGGNITLGERIMIEVVTHPAQRLNGKQIITTPVTFVGGWGVFETKNTVYIPEERMFPAVVQHD
jgi:hypothetical protein